MNSCTYSKYSIFYLFKVLCYPKINDIYLLDQKQFQSYLHINFTFSTMKLIIMEVKNIMFNLNVNVRFIQLCLNV